ncbi:uncharacterized protein C8R40DRAFT_337212 [Lentinula edodes]|uniref:uncharacterized protein n=1 Tax=Lentinula edodes TaxID=5353 RepID=UPI001E8E41D0|nr:uncharacterized protein C8R40DRAFT_337212 [Lentinula edodes]KAH7873943.1 hypothetical protein C8R40DRAFT_337212 [Lentinula edodes]
MAYRRVRIGNEEDSTDAVMGAVFCRAQRTLDQPFTSQSGSAVGSDQHSTTKHPRPRRTILNIGSSKNHQAIHHRYHLFKQCATTIYDERSLDNTPGFRAVVDVIKALYVLHWAGWVHRDISGGNV